MSTLFTQKQTLYSINNKRNETLLYSSASLQLAVYFDRNVNVFDLKLVYALARC